MHIPTLDTMKKTSVKHDSMSRTNLTRDNGPTNQTQPTSSLSSRLRALTFDEKNQIINKFTSWLSSDSLE